LNGDDELENKWCHFLEDYYTQLLSNMNEIEKLKEFLNLILTKLVNTYSSDSQVG